MRHVVIFGVPFSPEGSYWSKKPVRCWHAAVYLMAVTGLVWGEWMKLPIVCGTLADIVMTDIQAASLIRGGPLHDLEALVYLTQISVVLGE
jgi:hypothetical protein